MPCEAGEAAQAQTTLASDPSDTLPGSAAQTLIPGSNAYQSELMSRVEWRETPLAGAHFLRLDSDGTQAPFESIAAGYTLDVAAMYYAIASGDFSVSIQDVVDGGYWPFNEFPEGLNYDTRIYGCAEQRALRVDENGQGGIFEEIGSPEWVLRARADILRTYYTNYYYGQPDQTHDRSRPLSSFITGFWTNPLNGEPMKLGGARGDFSNVPVDDFSLNPGYQRAEFAFAVPHVNVFETRQQ
jgi:hypothetical protein